MNTALIRHENLSYISFAQLAVLAANRESELFSFSNVADMHLLLEAIAKDDEAGIFGILAARGSGFVVEGRIDESY